MVPIAIGLGIDKPDVCFVIHHSTSNHIFKLVENCFQKSGQVGCDGFQTRHNIITFSTCTWCFPNKTVYYVHSYLYTKHYFTAWSGPSVIQPLELNILGSTRLSGLLVAVMRCVMLAISKKTMQVYT